MALDAAIVPDMALDASNASTTSHSSQSLTTDAPAKDPAPPCNEIQSLSLISKKG